MRRPSLTSDAKTTSYSIPPSTTIRSDPRFFTTVHNSPLRFRQTTSSCRQRASLRGAGFHRRSLDRIRYGKFQRSSHLEHPYGEITEPPRLASRGSGRRRPRGRRKYSAFESAMPSGTPNSARTGPVIVRATDDWSKSISSFPSAASCRVAKRQSPCSELQTVLALGTSLRHLLRLVHRVGPLRGLVRAPGITARQVDARCLHFSMDPGHGANSSCEFEICRRR